MIVPPEKTKGLVTTDGESRRVPKAPQPPLINLEYQPESSALPTFPTPFDNTQPPSYSDLSATSTSSSYFAPTSSITETVAVDPTAPDSTASFTRVPSRDVMYPSFQPMFLIATGKTLDKGFPYASPPSKSNPHPFVSHDINEGDWISFLEEARMAATLTDKQIGNSRLPIVCLVPGVGCATSYGVKRLMKYRNTSKVVDCIDKWNRHFFEQRKIRIVLMKGQVKVSAGQKTRNEYLKDTPTPASSSSNLRSDYQKYYEDHSSSSQTSFSQELVGKNDNIYRLFVVPLS